MYIIKQQLKKGNNIERYRADLHNKLISKNQYLISIEFLAYRKQKNGII